MRHTTAILAIFLAVGARAADTTTPRYGLIQPASGSTNWASKVNGDFSVLDTSAASLGSTNTFTSAATTTVNAPWTWSASSITMSGSASYIVSGSSVNAGYFTGNGAGITNLPAASVASGILGSQVIASSVAAQAVGPDQLAKTAVTAGSYGSATAAPTLTVDAQGRLTAAGSATVTPAAGSITAGALVAGVTITPGGVDLSTVTTALAGKQATGNYITALTGNVTASGPGSVAATVVNVPQSAVNLSTVTTVFSNVAADTTTLYNIKASTGIDAGMTRAKNLATIDAALTASSTMTVLGSDAASNSLKLAGGGDVGGQLVVAGTATVQGSAMSVGTKLYVTSTGLGLGVAIPLYIFHAHTATDHNWSIGDDTNGSDLLAHTDANAYTTGEIDAKNLLLNVNGGGNVGIGTASPGTTLDVNGASSLRGAVTVTNSSITSMGTGITLPALFNCDNFQYGCSLRYFHNHAYAGDVGVDFTGNNIGTSLAPNTLALVPASGNVSITNAGGFAVMTTSGATKSTSFYGAVTVAGSSMTVTGIVSPGSYTTAQLAPGGSAPTPGGAGGFVFNSTISDLCVSTGSASGNWALAGSKGATGCF